MTIKENLHDLTYQNCRGNEDGEKKSSAFCFLSTLPFKKKQCPSNKMFRDESMAGRLNDILETRDGQLRTQWSRIKAVKYGTSKTSRVSSFHEKKKNPS